MMLNNRKIRVLIVEDTLVGQGLLKGLLADDPRFEVAGIVGNGSEAVEFAARQLPDVISMDIFMPVMDGVEATRTIMCKTPVPIVIVSGFYELSEIQMSFRILEAGALTIMPRPFGPGHPQYNQSARNYRNTLKMMSEVTVKARHPAKSSVSDIAPRKISLPEQGRNRTNGSPFKIIAIGASAGGPEAIQAILTRLPKNLPVPILIVQHIDANFAVGFTDWLNSSSNLPVVIAGHGSILQKGTVYLAPGDCHLRLQCESVVAVTRDPPEKGLRPAVSVLFRDVLSFYGPDSICILLSGMGSDGASELKMLLDKGAMTIAQDAESSLVHGMPGEAIRLGGATRVLSPEEIAKELTETLLS